MRVRAVAPGDGEAIQGFVRRLSNGTRQGRFFGPIRELHPDMLARMTAADHVRDEVLLAVAPEAGRETVVAIAQYAALPGRSACDFAVVVDDAWQGNGLARHLLDRLLAAAARAGFGCIQGDVLPANRPMVELARASGFELAHHPEDPTMLRIVRRLPAHAPAVRVRKPQWRPAMDALPAGAC